MKKKNEESGKEGDEPKIEQFDEEKEVTDSGENEHDNRGGRYGG